MEIRYTEHLKLRLKLRDIPYDMPREIYESAEENYYDNGTSYYVALKRLDYAGKIRTMAIVYDKYEEHISIITIYPIKEHRKDKRIKVGRWVKL